MELFLSALNVIGNWVVLFYLFYKIYQMRKESK